MGFLEFVKIFLYFLECYLLERNFSTYLRRICTFSALARNSLMYNVSLLFFLFLDVLSIGGRGNEVTYYCVLSYMRYIWFNMFTSVCLIKFSVTTFDVCMFIISISCYWSLPLPIWRPSSFLMTFYLGMFVGMCFVLLDGFCHIDLEYWFASLHFGCMASFACEVLVGSK